MKNIYTYTVGPISELWVWAAAPSTPWLIIRSCLRLMQFICKIRVF